MLAWYVLLMANSARASSSSQSSCLWWLQEVAHISLQHATSHQSLTAVNERYAFPLSIRCSALATRANIEAYATL